MHTLGSDVSDHTHSEPFHVYSDLTELKAVKAKATTKITDTSLRNDLMFFNYILTMRYETLVILVKTSFYMLNLCLFDIMGS